MGLQKDLLFVDGGLVTSINMNGRKGRRVRGGGLWDLKEGPLYNRTRWDPKNGSRVSVQRLPTLCLMGDFCSQR